jgi:predicted phage terminase large subunit-like protein
MNQPIMSTIYQEPPSTPYLPESIRVLSTAEKREAYHKMRATPSLIETEIPPFRQWLTLTTPSYDWAAPHLCEIRKKLKWLTDGLIDRLMIFCPPRHGKSALVTIRYPIWRLEREQDLRVIVASYNQLLANRFSRQSRRIAATRLTLDTERKAVEEWQTAQGGVYRAVGVGGGITGQGANLIMIDDPVRSRDEAESASYRDRVWDWFTDDLWTRREPGAAMVLIMTRWHEADLAGRILASEDGPNWTVVNLPALAEENDPLVPPRQPGAALWPGRYDVADLEQIRSVMGTYSFAALYQQRPLPPGGGMFKREWFDVVGAAPSKAERVRAWDRAATEGEGDYTVGLLMAKDKDNVFYVEDVIRGQMSDLAVEKVIAQTAQSDAARYGQVATWLEQEPGSSGKAVVKNTIRNLAGYVVKAERSTGAKSTRAQPLAAQCEAHNVKIVQGVWNGAYLDELASFPYGAHDDLIDASSFAFNKLALSAPRRTGGSYNG